MARKMAAAKKKLKARRGIPEKGAAAAKARRLIKPREAKPETFSAPSVPPSTSFTPQRRAPGEEALRLPSPPVPEALKIIERKKRIPHAVTAVLAGAILALFTLFAFYVVLSAGDLLSFSLSAAMFIGFSIFLYNRLEGG